MEKRPQRFNLNNQQQWAIAIYNGMGFPFAILYIFIVTVINIMRE